MTVRFIVILNGSTKVEMVWIKYFFKATDVTFDTLMFLEWDAGEWFIVICQPSLTLVCRGELGSVTSSFIFRNIIYISDGLPPDAWMITLSRTFWMTFEWRTDGQTELIPWVWKDVINVDYTWSLTTIGYICDRSCISTLCIALSFLIRISVTTKSFQRFLA